MLKASVIIIVEPDESNLQDSLNSACSQLMTDYEVICVAGGAVPSAEEALQVCCGRYPMLSLIRLPLKARMCGRRVRLVWMPPAASM